MSAALINSHGDLRLVGPVLEELYMSTSFRSQLPNHPLDSRHILVASQAELRRAKGNVAAELDQDVQHLYAAGIGGAPEQGGYHLVIIWPPGQLLRKRLGLEPGDFYIQLSEPLLNTPSSEPDRSMASLLPSTVAPIRDASFMDQLCLHFHLFGRHDDVLKHATTFITASPSSPKGYIRLADAALKLEQGKLAMLSYASAYDRTEDLTVEAYCLKRLLRCSQQTEWGALFQKGELDTVPRAIRPHLLQPWSNRLRSALSEAEAQPTLTLLPKQLLSVPKPHTDLTGPECHSLPRWFRWLVPFRLAILSTPRNQEDVNALASPHIGIRHIVTLTEEEPLHPSFFRSRRITNTYIPVPNYFPPSIEQMDQIIVLTQEEKNLPLAFHCGGGRGRAGTVAACYIAAFGFGPPDAARTHPAMTAEDAMSTLRSIRPGSIETDRQEAFVSQWCGTIWKRQSVLPEIPSEPPASSFESIGSLSTSHDLIVLVGLPGSGKSWFSRALIARQPKVWEYISQDESGSRASCERSIGHVRNRAILDRCNPSPADRREWLALAANWVKSPLAVFFDYEAVLCTSRAQRRTSHPTLPAGNRVVNAMKQMTKMLSPPTLAEGFAAVVTVRSFEAALGLVLYLAPLVIHKFPRTAHLIDLGAMGSDDILVRQTLPETGAEVSITEKVDGANMGFSLSSSDRSRIVVQNRSHYVNTASHAQFKKLGVWVDAHRNALIQILGSDQYFPERYVLFGEWMYATHSITYTGLPDLFMAFDFYDRATDSWLARAQLIDLLADTDIQVVPETYRGRFPDDETLIKMTQQPSMFYDGPVEGIYLKVEYGGYVSRRQKVVRKGFISGNEHWSKEKLRLNTIEPRSSPGDTAKGANGLS